jgi:alanyl-tRNA synthetase
MTNNFIINPSYKVIADHIRSVSFLIADGVTPSNEGRGYVLRRIIRRAIRHIHKLKAKETTMHKLLPVLISQMGDAYPELIRAKDTIIDVLKTEEERFVDTIDRGMEMLEQELKHTKDGKIFSGKIAFKLYDTYGFPLDLTQDILREKNIEVDLASFDNEMELQKKRAKASWSGSGEAKDSEVYFGLKNKFGATEFLGYQTTKTKAKILTILKDGKEILETKNGDKNIEIILDHTPFYATAGGQKGDDGNFILSNEYQEDQLIDYQKLKNVIDIVETKKMAGDLFVHFVAEIRGSFSVGNQIIALVNNRHRQFRAINHSATHLLHFAIRQVLGNQITQKGSNVDSNYFTFDFNHNKPLSQLELDQIEDLVNFYIRQNSNIKTEILPLEEARDKGAIALFGEKYDSNQVRVLEIGKSVELCGGTHADATGNIGVFKIISEKGIAAGIRRIEAKTGFFATQHSRFQERKLQSLLDGLKIKQQFDDIKMPSNQFHSAKKGFDDYYHFIDENKKNIIASEAEIISIQLGAEKIYQLGNEKIIEAKTLQKEIEHLKQEKLSTNSNFSIENFGEVNFIHHSFDKINAKELREIIIKTKNKSQYQQNSMILFFSVYKNQEDENTKVSAILSISQNLVDQFQADKIILQIAQKIGGKNGGGKPDLAMCGGDNQGGIIEAINVVRVIF